MIKEKLLVMEYSLVTSITDNSAQINAIKQLKKALKQIDFKSEIIPISDFERLTKLFESLLDRDLNRIEISIIENIIEP